MDLITLTRIMLCIAIAVVLIGYGLNLKQKIKELDKLIQMNDYRVSFLEEHKNMTLIETTEFFNLIDKKYDEIFELREKRTVIKGKK